MVHPHPLITPTRRADGAGERAIAPVVTAAVGVRAALYVTRDELRVHPLWVAGGVDGEQDGGEGEQDARDARALSPQQLAAVREVRVCGA